MQVTYEITRKDFQHYLNLLRRRSTFRRFLYPLALIYFLAIALILGILQSAQGRFISTFIESMILGLIVIVAVYVTSRITAAYSFSRQEHMRGKHTLEIQPDGLKHWSPISEGTISWDGVLDVAEDKNSVYVFIGRGAAIIIPKRDFPSNEEAKHFLNTARAYKEASASEPQSPELRKRGSQTEDSNSL